MFRCVSALWKYDKLKNLRLIGDVFKHTIEVVQQCVL